MLTGDEKTYCNVAELIASNRYAKRDVRVDALSVFEYPMSEEATNRDIQALSRIIQSVSKEKYPEDADSYILFSAKDSLERICKSE